MKTIYLRESDYARLQELVSGAQRTTEEEKAYLDNLKNELGKATVVDEGALPPGIVAMYSKVDICDSPGQAPTTYKIVFPEEADIDQQKVSVLSPLGTAVIGEKEGAEVTLNLVRGNRKILIKKVSR